MCAMTLWAREVFPNLFGLTYPLSLFCRAMSTPHPCSTVYLFLCPNVTMLHTFVIITFSQVPLAVCSRTPSGTRTPGWETLH